MKPERIAKVIARAGMCSRRDAEKLISEGKVMVDGKVIESPALNVTKENKIEVNGRPLLKALATRLWILNKPEGVITSNKDARKTVFDILPRNLPRVISIGRLDLNSEGLLLLTNDGEFARKLELPSTGWVRKYRVRVYGEVDDKKLADLKNGIEIDGIKYKEIEAKREKKSEGKNSWLLFSLKEGKNREIRKICQHLGLAVNRLIRTSYGPFELGKIEPGDVMEVPKKILDKYT